MRFSLIMKSSMAPPAFNPRSGEPSYCPSGGCQSSTLLPSGSMTQPNFPYSESSSSRARRNFLAQRFEESIQIFDSIVDHEGRLARSEVLAVRRTDRPGRSALGRVAFGVRPLEGCSTPGLNVDPEVLLVPIAQRLGILGAQEDAANACHSSHPNLRCMPFILWHITLHRFPSPRQCERLLGRQRDRRLDAGGAPGRHPTGEGRDGREAE